MYDKIALAIDDYIEKIKARVLSDKNPATVSNLQIVSNVEPTTYYDPVKLKAWHDYFDVQHAFGITLITMAYRSYLSDYAAKLDTADSVNTALNLRIEISNQRAELIDIAETFGNKLVSLAGRADGDTRNVSPLRQKRINVVSLVLQMIANTDTGELSDSVNFKRVFCNFIDILYNEVDGWDKFIVDLLCDIDPDLLTPKY